MQWRGRYVLVVLAVLACALIYYRNSPGKSGPTHTAMKSRPESEPEFKSEPKPESEPDRAPVAAVQRQPQPVAPADAGSRGGQGAAIDAGGLQANPPASVMQQIRDSLKTNPKLAESLVLQLRDQKNENPDPADPEADELDALLVAAIFNQHQIDRARFEAIRYFKRHPGGRYTDYLIKATRMHPPPAPVRN